MTTNLRAQLSTNQRPRSPLALSDDDDDDDVNKMTSPYRASNLSAMSSRHMNGNVTSMTSPFRGTNVMTSPYRQANGNVNNHQEKALRKEWDLPITKLDQMKNLASLSGLSIPRTDFLKALNFERFSARSRLEDEREARPRRQGSEDEEEEDEEEQEEEESEEEEEYVPQHSIQTHMNGLDSEEDNDSDAENRDPNDPNDANDANDADGVGDVDDVDGEGGEPNEEEIDQAELLAKFQQLRQMQFEEQQRLMELQQEQLNKLRQEQQLVQDLLMTQQMATLSPRRQQMATRSPRRTAPSMDSHKIKLIHSPDGKTTITDHNHNTLAAPLDSGTLNHHQGEASNADLAPYIVNSKTTSNVEVMTSDQEVVTSDEEDDVEEEDGEGEDDVDEDYLQCSMVENEADAHVSHVEDLLRNSRDLFASKQDQQETPHIEQRISPAKPIFTPDIKENVSLDDKPVSGARKTFEELLEEKLRQESPVDTTPAAPPSGQNKKRPFLKRGQGTARFGTLSPASRRPTPRSAPRGHASPPKSSKQATQPSPSKHTSSLSRIKSSATEPVQEITLKLHKPQKSPIKKTVLQNKKVATPSNVTSSDTPNSAKRCRLDDVDIDDIEEFELLEKYADDDYSFTSNCSIIKPRPQKMKKHVIGFGKVDEVTSADEVEDVMTRDVTTPVDPIMTSPPSSTPRRLKRKIASRAGGPATTVEKDVMVEDYSPSVAPDSDKENETEKETETANFEDDECWADSIPKPNFNRPLSQSQTVKSDTPPVSKLVAKLFPSLKPKPKEEEKQKPATQPTAEGVMSKALKDKLQELESEIAKFRQENAVLAKIKKERLDGLEALKNEVEQFERKKNHELQDIQEMRDNEMKKLKNERKMFEKYQKEMRAIPDKNQRREIEDLKGELADLKEEMRQKETRWSSSTNRLRNRIETLEKENGDLQEELKMIEKQRLELWQKELKSRNEKKKTQCVPPQQQQRVQSEESSATAELRHQFDKLLRASLDDFPTETKSSMNSVVVQPPNPSKPANKKRPTTVAPAAESHPRKPQQQKQQQPNVPNPVTLATTETKPKPHITNKPADVKIDHGDGNYRELRHKDGKIERTFSNGSKEVIFANGSRKQISRSGDSVIVSFFNGDIKQILPDQRVVYYYADTKTKHTTYPDGTEILEFVNQQVEKHYSNGTREILFPDQTIKYLYPGGGEESVFPDGTVVKVDSKGGRVMQFPNGQKEVHTQEYKRREYPDGTTKTVFPDGRQETRYSSGRVRVKDAEGNVLVDTMS